MPESAAELEQRAERAVRRGELLAALQLFEELIVRQPQDERVRQRMESVRALLQPAELVGRRRSEPEEADPRPPAGTLTDAEQGELHAGAGRFVEALRCYERAVAQSPDNELLRERLHELGELAPPGDTAACLAAPAPFARARRGATATWAPEGGSRCSLAGTGWMSRSARAGWPSSGAASTPSCGASWR